MLLSIYRADHRRGLASRFRARRNKSLILASGGLPSRKAPPRIVFAHKNEEPSSHTAIQLFQQAVTADPKFVIAWAWLARMQAATHFGDDLATVR